MKDTKLYSMRAITNMHPGSGDNNYGVVDKLIQRDAVDNMPTIHSSSLKGALRAFIKSTLLENSDQAKQQWIEIFGSESKSDSKSSKQGGFNFFEADFVSFPVRSDKAAFLNMTSPERLKKIIDKAELFGIKISDDSALRKLSNMIVEKDKPVVFNQSYDGACIEEYSLMAKYVESSLMLSDDYIKNLIGDNIVLLNDCNFREICEDMPVVARNQLESGESKNLWYEEIVPHQSRFAFFVSLYRNAEHKTLFNKITESRVQIGANATIGYGQTDINEVDFKTN